MVALKEKDLDFLISEAAPQFPDKAKLKKLLLEDPDFRRSVTCDPKVFRKVVEDENIFLRLSPALYFEILLRNALKELKKASHTVERVGSYPVPVFDIGKVVELLSLECVLYYLVDMLSSFTRVESYVISIRLRGGVWRKLKFSDLDIDSLIMFCEVVPQEQRLGFYKRIADVCLFILGIFPEYVQSKVTRRSLEEEGRRFYKLAGQHSLASGLSEVFHLLYENFHTAKKPLNFISEHYLRLRKHKLFGMEAFG